MNYRRINSSNLAVFNELNQNNWKELEEFRKAVTDGQSLFLGYWNNDSLIAIAGIKYLDFDSRHFGYKVGRLEEIRCDTMVVPRKEIYQTLLGEALCEGFVHITAKCYSEKISDVKELENAGFHVVVCNIILCCEISSKKLTNPSFPVRIVTHADIESLKYLTFTSFSDKTRFHLDGHFSHKKSTDLHLLWIENLLKNKNVKIWCAEIDSKIVGFITCQILENSDISKERISYIDLVAVDKRYQGMGIGSSLIKTILHYVKGKTEKLMVDTESINYAALRLYQKNDFFITGSRYILHKWLGNVKNV